MFNIKPKSSQVISDDEIVRLYWERNELAINQTDIKYGQFLLRIARNILHDNSDCEECQNDTYYGIWNSIPPNKPKVFPAYITKIMRNTAIDKLKERTRKKQIPTDMKIPIEELEFTLSDCGSPETEYSAKELGDIINKYLFTLSPRQQYVFIGRFYICDTLEVIASELDVNVSTVQRETEKIKQGLKSYLERNGIYV